MSEHERNEAEQPAVDMIVVRQAGLARSAAGDVVLERALAEAAALEGGSLLVMAGRKACWWFHMPEPWVVVASIEEAHQAWPRRVYEAVLIARDVPDPGVEAFCARVQGVASCVRFAYVPTAHLEGPPEDEDLEEEPFEERPRRPMSLTIGPFGTVLVERGYDRPDSSMWGEATRGLMEHTSHLCYLERQRCKKAGDRALKHAASVRAWPADPGGLRAV